MLPLISGVHDAAHPLGFLSNSSSLFIDHYGRRLLAIDASLRSVQFSLPEGTILVFSPTVADFAGLAPVTGRSRPISDAPAAFEMASALVRFSQYPFMTFSRRISNEIIQMQLIE